MQVASKLLQMSKSTTIQTNNKNHMSINKNYHHHHNQLTSTPAKKTEPKFDPKLNSMFIDLKKIDDKKFSLWLKDCLHELPIYDEPDLIYDLILNHIENERFPDHKSMQCHLVSSGCVGLDKAKYLVSKAWNKLKKLQDKDPDSSSNHHHEIPRTRVIESTSQHGGHGRDRSSSSGTVNSHYSSHRSSSQYDDPNATGNNYPERYHPSSSHHSSSSYSNGQNGYGGYPNKRHRAT